MIVSSSLPLAKIEPFGLKATDGYGNYANMFLYRDNGNGYFDSSDQLISNNNQPSDRDEIINSRVNAGTYFAQVQRDYYSPSSNNVTYDLILSATSPTEPNNLLAKEVVVGTLSNDLTYNRSVTDATYQGNTSEFFLPIPEVFTHYEELEGAKEKEIRYRARRFKVEDVFQQLKPYVKIRELKFLLIDFSASGIAFQHPSNLPKFTIGAELAALEQLFNDNQL